MWSKMLSDGASVEGYKIGAYVFAVLRYERGGWSILTSDPYVMVPAALRDAERRLGLASPPLPAALALACRDDDGQRTIGIEVDDSTLNLGDEAVRRALLESLLWNLSAEAAEALGMRLIALADSARDPR